MVTEQFSNNATTTLNGGIASTDTSLTVTSATLFPSSAQFRILVDSEIMLVTAVAGNVFTITRASEGTTAAAHLSGATVSQILTAGALSQLKTDVIINHVVSSTKTSTYTVAATDNVVACNTSGGSFTVFLPSSPSTGEAHTITDVGGACLSKPLTINGNGKSLVTASTVLASTDTISVNYGSNSYMYNGTFWSLL